jgi:hypothetical protein
MGMIVLSHPKKASVNHNPFWKSTMPILENLKNLAEASRNKITATLTMPINFVLGKNEVHHHYHNPIIVLDKETAKQIEWERANAQVTAESPPDSLLLTPDSSHDQAHPI